MSVPKTVNDGDFTKQALCGTPEYCFPFYDRGDDVSFEWISRWRCDARSYARLPLMTRYITPKGSAYLVNEGDPRDVGNGLLETKRTWASLPVTRIEGSSISYSFQFYRISAGLMDAGTPEIAEFPSTVSCDVKFEYFLTKPQPLIAPRIGLVFNNLQFLGGYGALQNGRQYPAQDSDVDIYKGRIYVRKTLLFTWGFNISQKAS